ncbi:MAG: DOMON-like domain-containing protein [Caulobacterales bacterium]|nr:DOMON-like domain-containing protein [Caulobacterales bacterium]
MTGAALALAPFPGSQVPDIGIEMRVDRPDPNALRLDLEITGDVAAVRLPPRAQRSRADELWRTTCFEAFIQGRGGGYVELNLSPSGQWAAYGFDGYRTGMAPLDGTQLQDSALDLHPDRLTFTATLDLDRAPVPAGPWRLALSCVIETLDGAVSYWALAHPSDKPDFHHPDSFVLELP